MENDINACKDHGAKKKTPLQLQSLENFYAEEKYPNHKAMEDYATSLSLTYNQIRIWFVERRRKERRENEVLSPSNSNILGSGKVQEHTCSTTKRSGINIKENSTTYIGHGLVTQKFKRPMPAKKNRNISSGEKDRRKVVGPCSKNCVVGRNDYKNEKHCVPLQVVLSKDYILRKLFRKDGPPLGVEFDPLPANIFSEGSENLRSYESGKRNHKGRKVMESSIVGRVPLHKRNVSEKKYGIGKGFMTVWHSLHSNQEMLPTVTNPIDERASQMFERSNTLLKETLRQASKKQKPSRRKVQEKRKASVKRKVSYSSTKKPSPTECKLSTEYLRSLEHSNEMVMLVDDEELELRELQATSNPLRCSAHLASNGRHDCSLCKDSLCKFPPQMVKMKLPFCTRPWDSSPEIVKKLFKVFRFLYTNAMVVEVCSFTLDEFAQAFHDEDSLLLGKIHVALLRMLLIHVEREVTAGFISRTSKDCRFRGFLHFVREQEFDVKFWNRSINPLTWIEVLRQVLIAAGFGSKNNSVRRDMLSKELNHMSKYGLRPCTLKGELFTMLSEKGTTGLKVSELAKAYQIVAVDLFNTTEELEHRICSTLSSDITLFEKISPSAYRLRVNPHIKGKADTQSDSDDSGSVDDDSWDVNRGSYSDQSESEELDSSNRRMLKYKAHCRKGHKMTEHTEIDESYSGEAWVLGLMEGEYSHLRIEEKLDALEALVDLAGACCSFRLEEPVRAIAATTPDTQYHGSGGKIKKALITHHQITREAWEGPVNSVGHPVNTFEILSNASKRGNHSVNIKNTRAAEESGSDVHPLQSIHLGSDRRYNGYWLFLGPCNANDPGHRRVYFESSEDGHWEVIDTSQALHALLSALDIRGSRESHLFASLEAKEAVLCCTMDDYKNSDIRSSQTKESDRSDFDHSSRDGSSPVSDIDNILFPVESVNNLLSTSASIVLELGKIGKAKEQKWDRLQAFDKWIWESFYSSLNAVKNSRKSFMESLARCRSCHDLYWRDEKHCRICHSTFEVDFDLEERYAIHVATCREIENASEFPKHKVLPSQLQALKAAIHAIEMCMPEAAFAGAWRKSGHKLWVKRLRRTSSLPELLQVLNDFVCAIREEWFCESAHTLSSNIALDEILVYFQTMPQTTSAVALWMVKLDMLIAPHLEKLQSDIRLGSVPQVKQFHQRHI